MKDARLFKTFLFFLSFYSLNLYAVEIPTGYRTEHYRAPTPASVPNATTVNTRELQALLAQESVTLIDVMAATYRPETAFFDGEWLLNEPHTTIKGAVWLPNVGYGTLDSLLQRYFQHYLTRLTNGNPHHPIVFYCILDCWMAWNAAKRAATELTYQRVYWYRDGMDGWEAAKLPTMEVQPLPIRFD